MNIRHLIMLFAALTVCAAGSAAAAVPSDPWYLGAGVGNVNTSASASDLQQALENQGYTVTSVNIDKPSVGWKLFGGFQLHPNWAVEMAFADLGEVTSDVTATGVTDINQIVQDAMNAHDFSAQGLTLDIMGMLNTTGPVVLFARAGGVYYKAKVKVNEVNTGVSAESTEWGTGAHYGVGVMFPVYQKRVNIRAEWERFRVSGESIDLYSISADFHFGG